MMVIKCCSAYCQDFAIPFLSRSYCPCFKIYTFELLCATPPLLCAIHNTVLMRFELNFHCGNGWRGSVRPSVRLSVRPSVRHTLLCTTPPTVLMRFELNFHRMIFTKYRSAYCQNFAIPFFIKELLPWF